MTGCRRGVGTEFHSEGTASPRDYEKCKWCGVSVLVTVIAHWLSEGIPQPRLIGHQVK
jgi:hypothetical protein